MKLEEIVTKFQGAKKIRDNSYQCICPTHRRFKTIFSNYRKK